MRTLHYDVRKYSEPISLLLFEYENDQGVMNYVLKKRYEIKGSLMNKQTIDTSNNQRSSTNQISLIIQKPPFNVEPENSKVIANGIIYKVVSCDYNRLNVGDINLILEFEFKDDGRYDG